MAYTVNITPLSMRRGQVEKGLEASGELGEQIPNFRGRAYKPKVISLPIDVPVYRLENCRTFSAQQSKIAREGLEKDFFEKGQELATAQQAQHEILLDLARQGSESIASIFNALREEGQRKAILITHTGAVVNGNLHLSAMREILARGDGTMDNGFAHVRCAVLPADASRDDVDDLEADLQARCDSKMKYDWVGGAKLIHRQVEKGRSVEEVADRLYQSISDVENALLALDEADLYLSDWLKKPGQYDLVKDGRQLFNDLPKALENKGFHLQNAIRSIAWTLYTNKSDISGSIYSLKDAYEKLATKVMEMLGDQLIPPCADDDLASDASRGQSERVCEDFAVNIESDDETDDYGAVVDILRSEREGGDAVNTLINACVTAIELDKGLKDEGQAVKTLAQLNSKIITLDVGSAGVSMLPGILEQVSSIRKGLDSIEKAARARQEENLPGDKEGQVQ